MCVEPSELEGWQIRMHMYAHVRFDGRGWRGEGEWEVENVFSLNVWWACAKGIPNAISQMIEII